MCISGSKKVLCFEFYERLILVLFFKMKKNLNYERVDGVFLMFSGGIEGYQWHEMGYTSLIY